VDASDWIDLYLREDLGAAGDITSNPIFSPEAQGSARLVAREGCFLAGIARASQVFERLECTIIQHMNDGSWITKNAVVLEVNGPIRGILAAERLALNMIGRMSGIATATRKLVERLGEKSSGTMVAATRKTTPGFRIFEKEAVLIAGGDPHREGLFDAAMVKDNHREASGDITTAVTAIRAAHPDKQITAEVESLEDAQLAAEAGADWLLIDNQTPEVGQQWAEAVWEKYPRIKMEASGGITPETVVNYRWADRISMGALTTQATSIDFGLDWGPA
jgi:nicotinate-nucleotide pyrophosphorylase (carboxylating)